MTESEENVSRRRVLGVLGGAVVGLVGWGRGMLGGASAATDGAAGKDFDVLTQSKSWWKERLPAASYRILFEEGTERPFTSGLLKEKRAGHYICGACSLPLFRSEKKYDSGTGWPSFFDVIPGRLAEKTDFKLIYPRTEYHCARCGGHQGHVFKDGPRPTGLRYCNNGLALSFVPDGEPLPELRQAS